MKELFKALGSRIARLGTAAEVHETPIISRNLRDLLTSQITVYVEKILRGKSETVPRFKDMGLKEKAYEESKEALDGAVGSIHSWLAEKIAERRPDFFSDDKNNHYKNEKINNISKK